MQEKNCLIPSVKRSLRIQSQASISKWCRLESCSRSCFTDGSIYTSNGCTVKPESNITIMEGYIKKLKHFRMKAVHRGFAVAVGIIRKECETEEGSAPDFQHLGERPSLASCSGQNRAPPPALLRPLVSPTVTTLTSHSQTTITFRKLLFEKIRAKTKLNSNKRSDFCWLIKQVCYILTVARDLLIAFM